jgi:hypothetical protein
MKTFLSMAPEQGWSGIHRDAAPLYVIGYYATHNTKSGVET